MKALISLILLLATGYAAVVALMYVVQDRLLFQPSRFVGSTPQSVGLAYEDIWIETADGERLHGWWIPHQQRRATIAVFHGNAGNISGRLGLASALHRLGVDVLLFDYRGYGQSSGRPSERGLYRDGEAIWQYLVSEQGVAPLEIVLHGRSLGTGVVTYLAARHEPGAVILESPFRNIRAVGAHHYPWLPVHLLMRARFDNESRMSGIRCPIIILHGHRDEVIPFEHGRRIFEAAGEPKYFVELDGRHNDGFFATGDRYLATLRRFIEAHLGRSAG